MSAQRDDHEEYENPLATRYAGEAMRRAFSARHRVRTLRDPWVWLAGLAGGVAGVLVAGLIGTRRVLRTPPMEIFRAAS